MPKLTITVTIRVASRHLALANFCEANPIPIQLDPATGKPPIDPVTEEPIITPLYTPPQWMKKRTKQFIMEHLRTGGKGIARKTMEAASQLDEDDIFEP